MTNLVKAAEDLPEIAVRRYERASILLTSNRLGEDWAKLPHTAYLQVVRMISGPPCYINIPVYSLDCSGWSPIPIALANSAS